MTASRPLLAVLLVALTACAGTGGGAAGPQELATMIDTWQRRSGAPAVVVAVHTGDGLGSEAGGEPWTHAAGTTTRESDQPVSTDAPFRAASITKLFVGAVVMLLVEEGQLSLDDPVRRHLPGAPIAAEATVRHLLGHTSGLPDHAAVPGLGEQLLADRERVWTPEEVVALVAELRPAFGPGEGFSYSNTGFVILGQLIEAVTGRTWAQEVQRRLIEPLDLAHTTIPSHTSPPAMVIAGYHDLDNDGDTENIEQGPWPALETEEGPAGAIVSTAADLARATRAILGGQLLEPGTVAAMTAPGPFDRRYDGNGLGVEWARPDRQTLVVGHGGFQPGFRSVTWYIPSADAVVTVWANESRVDPTDLAELLVLRLTSRREA